MVMNLKKAALFAIIGMSSSFIVRTLGTLSPKIFINLPLVRVAIMVHLLASLTLVFFFISFYSVHVQTKKQPLKNAAMLAVIGSSVPLLLHIKSLLLVFDAHMLPLLFMYHHIDAVVPLVSSIAILLFFIIYYREMPHKEGPRLKKAARSAIIGFSVFASLQAFVLFNYLYSGQLRWLSHLSRNIALGFMPIVLFAFIAVLYFFFTFYRTYEPSRRLE